MNRIKPIHIYCLCCLLAGGGVLFATKNISGFGQWYSAHVFPIFPNTLGRLLSPVPFSVFEFGIYFVLLAAVLLPLAGLGYVLWKKRFPKKAALRAGKISMVFACTSFLLLSLACLSNYSRDSFAKVAELRITPSSKEELHMLCALLIQNAAALSREIPIDGSGVFSASDSDVQKEAIRSMKGIGRIFPALSGYYPKPKPVFYSEGMSRIDLGGIYSPFTIEANYNDDMPDLLIPYTICHELAHLKGFIREDEAGFIAFLACRNSESVSFRYSGTICALRYALTAYYGEVSPEEYAALYETMPEQVERDLAANRAYWKGFAGKASEIATKANDSYLKANAQEGGVKSYGRMVDLLLAEYQIGAEEI